MQQNHNNNSINHSDEISYDFCIFIPFTTYFYPLTKFNMNEFKNVICTSTLLIPSMLKVR